MAASEHGNDAVMSSTQLVQYDDDDDERVNSHSDHMASARENFGGDIGMKDDTRISASNARVGDQEGMEGVAGTDRVDEGDRGYQDDGMDGGARDDVYMETSYREEIVVQQTHTVTEGSDMASEAMRVFVSYDTVNAVGHTEEMITSSTPGGNDYSEEDLQERGLEEVALEERVHGEQSPGYIPEEGGTGEGHSSFSSMQQLQLRAQILVYGDLIKGVLPEESLMSSAFSDANEGTEQESDRSPGGWNWEGPWQLAVEKEAERQRLAEEDRVNNKGDVIMTEGEVVNAGADNLEPGTPSTSPIRAAEDSIREEDLSAAMPQAVVTGDLSVEEQTADVNGMSAGLPVNLDAVVENIVATTVSSIDGSLLKDSAVEAQVTRSPSLDPWLKPPSAQVPPAPTSQAWQTPVQTANAGLGSQVAAVNTPVTEQPGVDGGVVANVPSNVEVPEKGSRKRKSRARERKTPAPKGTSTPRRSRAKTASVGKATPQPGIPEASLRTGAVPSRLIYESSEAAVVVQGGSPASPAGKIREAQGRSNLHAETQSWLEQAKASFEEAVSAANSAAEQVQLFKNVTATPKSGKEAQLASAAAAVNAAASVAKAAAEAAKVAYEAALQATMVVSDGMDTGLGKIGMGNGDKDGGLGGRRSAIAAAKEEARKRATATSSSMKTTPQSTDAVLRAARLMAEAASQAGAVLAKGNTGSPLTAPLSPVSQLDLRKSGARGRPKRDSSTFKSPEPIKTIQTEPAKNVKGSMKKGARRRGKELQELASSNTPVQGQAKLSSEKARRQLDQVIATATEPPEVLQQSQIVDGSLVEVMNDEEGLRGGWFSAKVLQLRTGEAYVQYDEILTDDGATQLKEWFPLEGPVDGRPRIRVISPNNIAREEGRRKRRRTTTGQKVWTIGDRVDAFVQDGWWEGLVKVVDEDDESKITVHFPGEGDTSTVKSWNLRPSFIWKNGRWEQWTRDASARTKQDDGHQSTKRRVSESPKVQARKSGRGKSNPAAGKVSDEATENSRASRRSKITDPQSTANLVSPPITTRSSPRQKIPPKGKDGPTEVSTPTQVPTPVSTRTRSIAEDAVDPVKKPLRRSAPSRTKSPLSPDVEKSETMSKELRALLGNSEPSQEKTRQVAKDVAKPATWRAKDVAKPATRRSARL